jgi:hypothetical protein
LTEANHFKSIVIYLEKASLARIGTRFALGFLEASAFAAPWLIWMHTLLNTANRAHLSGEKEIRKGETQ